jgi:hypothetical protein
MESAGRIGRSASELAAAQLVANTLEHHLNNKLAVTVACCEALTEDDRLPGELREQALKALRAAFAASETLNRLVHIARLEEDASIEGIRILDLERSAEAG